MQAAQARRMATLVGRKQVGFWNDSPFSTFPIPQDFVAPKWNANERDRVLRYLRGGEKDTAYFGISWCRFECGEHDMGCWDLTDGVWIWPEGFAHYLEKHDVKPPQEFVDYVLTKSR
jgi:hypothetical protein